jgi:hypothetical protein
MSEIVEHTEDLIPESVFGVPISEIVSELIISEIVSEPIINEIVSEPIISEIISEIVSETVNEIINQPIINEIINEPTILIDEITKITFSQIFENFLSKNNDQLTEYNITITPNMHKYFTLLCKENNSIFNEIELTLKTIILDDKIDIKDVPNVILIVTKIYNIIKNDKYVPNCDPYELIITLLKVLIILYIKTNKIGNEQLVGELDEIIKASTDLIKLKAIKRSIFSCLKNLKLTK